ncbi:MAG: hypothetical protein RLZZ165_1697 [Bacteroidota bacterium]|jgi:hypothetical protein
MDNFSNIQKFKMSPTGYCENRFQHMHGETLATVGPCMDSIVPAHALPPADGVKEEDIHEEPGAGQGYISHDEGSSWFKRVEFRETCDHHGF